MGGEEVADVDDSNDDKTNTDATRVSAITLI